MFCQKCGAQIIEGMSFCQKCGAKAEKEDAEAQAITTPEAANEGAKVENGTASRQDPSKFSKWWDSCSKGKKVLVVIAALIIAIPVVMLVLSFLKKFGVILFVILAVLGLIVTFVKGSNEEKRNAKKYLVKTAAWFAAIVVIVIAVSLNPDIIKPGVGVRDAYLTKYSDRVTVEQAFNKYFENEKWSTYKSDGYKYVVFKGVCEYMGERADAQITFKITGENFLVERLDINGTEQNDLILMFLLSDIYDTY